MAACLPEPHSCPAGTACQRILLSSSNILVLPAGDVALTCLLACPWVRFLPIMLFLYVAGDHCTQTSV